MPFMKSDIKLHEELEKLDEMGQESEIKAAKAVIEAGKETKKEDDKFEEDKLSLLEKKSKFQFKPYKHELAEVTAEVMRRREVCPPGYLWDSWANDQGVGLTILTPDKEKYVRAFKPINIPKYDLNACVVLCAQAENLIDRLEAHTHREIILPNGHGR